MLPPKPPTTHTNTHAVSVDDLDICLALQETELGVHLLLSSSDTPCVCLQATEARQFHLSRDIAPFIARRLLDLDVVLHETIVAGNRAHKRILPRNPSPVAFDPSDGPRLYREKRSSIATLIRPLLLTAPDLSELYGYQSDGVKWLLARSAAILADDMGLGKTAQAISGCRCLIASGDATDALVIVPKSLVATWRREFTKWAPELAVSSLSPNRDDKDSAWQMVLHRFHVYITNYEHLREPAHSISSHHFGIIVADEAHRIRRTEAQVTQAVRRLSTDHWWALTGTPIERDETDLATLLSTVDSTRFAPSDQRLAVGVLRSRARPYILRRRRDEVLHELPPVTENIQWLQLTPQQRRSYDESKARAVTLRGAPGRTLNLINDLRSICDFDPRSGSSSKLDRICEIIDNVRSNQEKAVIFSHLLPPLRLLEERFAGLFGNVFVKIDGTLGSNEREQRLHQFQRQTDISILLASTRVVGEGLTLVEANHVVFLNEWWNPSSNRQARDRVVRIGQHRPVQVYKFRCEDTIEESLHTMLIEKQDLFDEVIEALSTGSGRSDLLRRLTLKL